MAERPRPLRQLNRYFAAATIAHEYIADLHRELAALHQDSAHTRELLRESAAVVLVRMPEITRELRRSELLWDEQQLLDPSQAKRTLKTIETDLDGLEPEQLSGSVKTKSPKNWVSSSNGRAAAERLASAEACRGGLLVALRER